MEVPDIKYANASGLRIAYQRFGSGPDVLVVPPFLTNVELFWEQELYRRVIEHGARYGTFIHFDKRGMGCSDRFERAPTLDERIEDILAVLDAEGIARASVMGLSEGGLMAQHFAARHPERVAHLALVNSAPGKVDFATVIPHVRDTDPPYDRAAVSAYFAQLPDTWGRDPQFSVDWVAPSQAHNPSFVRWYGRLQRQSASPADAARHITSIIPGPPEAPELASIQAPTTVITVIGDRIVPPCVARWLASAIPHATLLEFPGTDHFCWMMPNWRDIWDAWMNPIVGAVPASGTERRFATVLFTDLVGSTKATARAGDGRWRDILDSHDRVCASVVDRHCGRLVKTTGDGVLATFDSPSAALAAASDLVSELAALDLTIRAGLHAGECEFRANGDVTGTAVNLAARVEQSAKPGTVAVSSTVRDLLLGGDTTFAELGEYRLKGFDNAWKLYTISR